MIEYSKRGNGYKYHIAPMGGELSSCGPHRLVSAGNIDMPYCLIDGEPFQITHERPHARDICEDCLSAIEARQQIFSKGKG